ncbi:pyridoxal-phosphate dependent enzyme [Glomus cerebriforme]|uniref:cystathionine beta-synthase n=1 Tax=Glomus cerebriforme TaxID=658196 RepID=A0A397TPB6_9GLOM|nr:pyridoxal-phosphate dependent enzyme [Glomus cerebriforme]
MSSLRLPPPIFDDITSTIGNTPIVRIKSISTLVPSIELSNIELLVKLEYLNSLSGSIKDRVAKRILEDAEKENKINSDTTLLIPTTGNLGISIAMLAHKKGYKTIVLVPERTTIDRIHILKALGAEIIRTQNEAHHDAPESNFSLAKKLSSEITNSIVVDEFNNQNNYKLHYEETAEEIYTQVEGKLNVLVVGVESGATITGLAKNLKSRIPGLKVVAVEPQHSRIQDNIPINPSSIKDRKVEDIGSNFTPPILDKSLIDSWIKVIDQESFAMSRRLINNGLLAGPSSGSVVSAALSYVKRQSTQSTTQDNSTRILCILNDTARNYSTTLLSDEWLLENDLMDDEMVRKLEYQKIEKFRAASVEDLQLPAAVTISPNATISHAIELMLDREYSQLPVIDTHKKLIGYVSLASLQTHLEVGEATLKDAISDWMFSFGSKNGGAKRKRYQLVTPDTPLSELAKFFEKHSFAVVTDSERKWCLGVATKYDLINFLNHRNSGAFS